MADELLIPKDVDKTGGARLGLQSTRRALILGKWLIWTKIRFIVVFLFHMKKKIKVQRLYKNIKGPTQEKTPST